MKFKDALIKRVHHVKALGADHSLRDVIRALPKHEFHVHLAGSIRRETIIDLSEKHGIPLPSSKKQFLEAITPLEFSSGTALWELFHETYRWYWSHIRSCRDLERIVIEMLEDSCEQGIIHSEFTVSGSYLMQTFPFDEWTDAVMSGIDTAQKGATIDAAAILDISRRFGAENALANVMKVVKARPKCICGIGMGGDEIKYPHRLFKEAFAAARENDIPTNVHVAEFTPGETTIEAIEQLKPKRLGHALTTARSASAYKLLKDSGIHVESCPLCNYVGVMDNIDHISEHPIRKYYDEGIPISINTDDPRIFGYDLLDTYISLMKEAGFTLEEFQDINLKAKEFAFLRG